MSVFATPNVAGGGSQPRHALCFVGMRNLQYTDEPWLLELYVLHKEVPAENPHAEWTARAAATCVAFTLEDQWQDAHDAVRTAITRGPDGGLWLLRCWLRASIGLFADDRDVLDVKITDGLGVPTLFDESLPASAAVERLDAIVAAARAARMQLARFWSRRAAGISVPGEDPLAGLTTAERVTLGWQLCLGIADWVRTDHPGPQDAR